MNKTPSIAFEKNLGSFTLFEYELPDTPGKYLYQIDYVHDHRNYTYSFGSWGMERDEITEKDCEMCCLAMMWFDCTASFSSFATNLQYTKDHLILSEDDVLGE